MTAMLRHVLSLNTNPLLGMNNVYLKVVQWYKSHRLAAPQSRKMDHHTPSGRKINVFKQEAWQH